MRNLFGRKETLDSVFGRRPHNHRSLGSAECHPRSNQVIKTFG